MKDFRKINKTYDKISSIEMLEALDYTKIGQFFEKIEEILNPGGKLFVQVITIPEKRFDSYKNNEDFNKIFGPLGHIMEVEESKFDVITATSGSGPAWIYSYIHDLIKAGMENGLSEEEARLIVQSLFVGIANNIEFDTNFKELKNTSPEWSFFQEKWVEELIEILKKRNDKDFEKNITSHLRSFENLGDEEFQLKRKNNEQVTIKIISGIFSSASEKQIKGMNRRIETYIASIDRILSNRSLD